MNDEMREPRAANSPMCDCKARPQSFGPQSFVIAGIGDGEGQDKTVRPRPRKSSSNVKHGA